MADIVINKEKWPVIYITMSAVVEEGAEVEFLREMQDVLDQAEPYVIIFDGAEKVESPAFNSAYMKWYKQTKDLQKELCRGVVRVEGETTARKSLLEKAKMYAAKAVIPYPYEVCESAEKAEEIAGSMLAGK